MTARTSAATNAIASPILHIVFAASGEDAWTIMTTTTSARRHAPQVPANRFGNGGLAAAAGTAGAGPEGGPVGGSGGTGGPLTGARCSSHWDPPSTAAPQQAPGPDTSPAAGRSVAQRQSQIPQKVDEQEGEVR